MNRLLLTLLWAIIATLPPVARAQVYARTPVAKPPAWAPPGYARARYYYLPDLQVYYDVPAASFLLPHRGQWIALRQLPPGYRSYDLYAAPKVVLDYHGPAPFQHYEVHRQRFPRWHCPPHSVVEFRDAPTRGYVPGRRYRPHPPRYGDDDHPYAPEHPDDNPEGEYDYYGREEAARPGHRGQER
jgi:hypothetical protein